MPEYTWSRVVGHKENPKLELPKDVFTPVADVLVGPHQLNGVFAVTMHSNAPEVHYVFREFDKNGKARSDVSPGQMENRQGAYWNREPFVINCETGGRVRLYFKPVDADLEVRSLTVEGSLWRDSARSRTEG